MIFPKLKGARKLLKALGLALVLALVAGAAFAAYLVVLHSRPLILPAPTGSYAVGRTAYDWVDVRRSDPFSDRADEQRELLVWVWYPAANGVKGATAPFLPADWIEAHDKEQGIGRFIESDLSVIRTHSFEDAPIAESPGGFPVVIMQPGLGPVPTDYTVFAENLASHGYMVLGLNQTYSSDLVVFPDGRAVSRTDRGTIADDADTSTIDAAASRIGKVWAEDAIFVMDELQRVNAEPAAFLYNKVDLGHIGLFGHSFGGATAASTCKIDARCKAGADLDGTLFSYQVSGTLQAPFMFMAEAACASGCKTMHQAYSESKSAAYYLTIKGARHFNFSDLPLRWLRPGRLFFAIAGYTGSIPPERSLEITNVYLAAFFDRYLKNVDSELLHGPLSAYPEVDIGKR